MAFPGKKISNPYTGQSILFLQTARETAGALLEMETAYTPHSKEPVAHFHPFQEELFTVISGSLTVKMGNEKITLTPGQQLHVPRNTVHAMWNESSKTTIVNWKTMPALQTEYFLENAMGLAQDGKTNSKGMPALLQVALMAGRFQTEFRLSKPSPVLQKIVFGLLKPFALLAGYKSSYQEYTD